MCPSYLATRDEKDSTRGRARVLQEALDGSLVKGLADPAVHEALDLCLACKGCASDCPTGVDMATYKAEALHQTYDRASAGRAATTARPAAEVGPDGRAGGAAREPDDAARPGRAAGQGDRRASTSGGRIPAFAPKTLRRVRRRAGRGAGRRGSGRTRSPTTSCPDTALAAIRVPGVGRASRRG